MEEKKSKKTKHFLNQPQYPGGKKALLEFIRSHLQYPEDALQQRIEGIVTVTYQVTDEGEIENPTIIKGLCPSCNEEAIRLVKLLKYNKCSNRGVRLKSNCRVNIGFHLSPSPLSKPSLSITYNSVASAHRLPDNKPKSYQYTIKIN